MLARTVPRRRALSADTSSRRQVFQIRLIALGAATRIVSRMPAYLALRRGEMMTWHQCRAKPTLPVKTRVQIMEYPQYRATFDGVVRTYRGMVPPRKAIRRLKDCSSRQARSGMLCACLSALDAGIHPYRHHDHEIVSEEWRFLGMCN